MFTDSSWWQERHLKTMDLTPEEVVEGSIDDKMAKIQGKFRVIFTLLCCTPLPLPESMLLCDPGINHGKTERNHGSLFPRLWTGI